MRVMMCKCIKCAHLAFFGVHSALLGDVRGNSLRRLGEMRRDWMRKWGKCFCILSWVLAIDLWQMSLVLSMKIYGRVSTLEMFVSNVFNKFSSNLKGALPCSIFMINHLKYIKRGNTLYGVIIVNFKSKFFPTLDLFFLIIL